MAISRKNIDFFTGTEDIAAFVDQFYQRGLSRIALDLEGESNQHRYGFHLCLIQFYDGERFTLIDPMAGGSIAPLQRLFEDPEVTKVAYATDFDVRLLHRTHGYELHGLFDLQIAAKLLGHEDISLAALVRHYLQLEFVKNGKLQRANWNLRPIKEELLMYAAEDVAHHLSLATALDAALAERGLQAQCLRQNQDASKHRFVPKPRPWMSVKGAGLLSREARFVLRYLFEVREDVAREIDFPPYWVIPNEKLSQLAASPPESAAAWVDGKHLPPKAIPFADRFDQAAKAAWEEVERRKRENERL